MVRRIVALSAFGVVIAGSLASQVACWNLPISQNLVCHPARVDALSTERKHTTPAKCEVCLEDQCCDPIYACEGESACIDKVHAAHDCALADDKSEGTCRRDLETDAGATSKTVQTYQCMYEHCGNECGFPVCQVDPSYALVIDVPCDRCIANGCCTELNACAKDRGCKLVTDCILQNCGQKFAGIITAIDPNNVTAFRDQACAGNSPPPPPGQDFSCVSACFEQYRDYDQSPSFKPEERTACLSTSVLACIVKAGCGASCASPADAGSD